MSVPIHVHPTAELAARVLLPGDPGRALLLAQALLEAPKMFNHNRGLWGYTGAGPDGEPLTVQATGMGGPSTAIVVRELVDLGAQTLVRVGTCGALVPELRIGQLVVATEALAGDGTSRALGAGDRVAPDGVLVEALRAAAPDAAAGPVVSTDVFYGEAPPHDGALAIEMEAATLFQLGANLGVATGCVLGVSDTLAGDRERIDEEGLAALGEAVGRAGAAALAV
jgi:uridine phosphorylase